jgi:hypothetical protein
MTRDDDIIRMAREAGWSGIYTQWISGTEHKTLPIPVTMEELSRFANLVAAQEREACKQWFIDDSERFAAQVALAEREACAAVCDARYMGDNNREDMEARRCAAAIRARGQE